MKDRKRTMPRDPNAPLYELINERHRMLWDLFGKLGTSIQTYERINGKFRFAVALKLARIETMLALMLGVKAHRWKDSNCGIRKNIRNEWKMLTSGLRKRRRRHT